MKTKKKLTKIEQLAHIINQIIYRKGESNPNALNEMTESKENVNRLLKYKHESIG